MPKILTRRATPWIGQVPQKVINGLPLNHNISATARYSHELIELVNEMTALTARDIHAYFAEPAAREYFAQDATVSGDAKRLMQAILKKIDDLFATFSRPIAERMAKDAIRSSEFALKGSLKQLSGGLTIDTDILTGDLKDIVKATIEENVSLIRSIGTKYHTAVQGAVYRSITTGNGLADLVPFLQRYKGITKRRAQFIAEDQTRKAFNTINKGRMQRVGVEQYTWLHTGGSQHPRKLHVRMSGNVYSFDKPPIIDERTGERGIPGQLPNCRCRMQPVIKFNEG